MCDQQNVCPKLCSLKISKNTEGYRRKSYGQHNHSLFWTPFSSIETLGKQFIEYEHTLSIRTRKYIMGQHQYWTQTFNDAIF